MEGMFRANGGCGYVKKPDLLLNNNGVFNPQVKLPVKTTLMVCKKSDQTQQINLFFLQI